jgi:hypothetical protein
LSAGLLYTSFVVSGTPETEAKILAYSPGRYPILVVEMPSGELRTFYYETGYDPQLTKPASEEWLRENALGRHSFVEVSPPQEVQISDLRDYVRRKLLEES